MGFLGKLFGKKENDTIENTVTQQITTAASLSLPLENNQLSSSPLSSNRRAIGNSRETVS